MYFHSLKIRKDFHLLGVFINHPYLFANFPYLLKTLRILIKKGPTNLPHPFEAFQKEGWMSPPTFLTILTYLVLTQGC